MPRIQIRLLTVDRAQCEGSRQDLESGASQLAREATGERSTFGIRPGRASVEHHVDALRPQKGPQLRREIISRNASRPVRLDRRIEANEARPAL